MESVVTFGDGRTRRTAFKVISIPEEYLTLWYFDLTALEQRVETLEGVPFDVFPTKSRETNEVDEVHFDISIFAKNVNQAPDSTAASGRGSP